MRQTMGRVEDAPCARRVVPEVTVMSVVAVVMRRLVTHVMWCMVRIR